ncbi:unnamed protein product [Arctia plantaginis]|uniref:Uncharacterized protein n=1 Tax=Arctia plantaginis TaxID=874455 RepID=A0A8S0ZMI8_ARCPL|nr:unnamed protein product [Arctia plantaginis]CAB3241986.1 unnamed protein product [Arctia plantaginis]
MRHMQCGARAAALHNKLVSEYMSVGQASEMWFSGSVQASRPRPARCIANIPDIQHARPRNATRQPDTPTQLFCIAQYSLTF